MAWEKYIEKEYTITKKSERTLLAVGISLALFLGLGIGYLINGSLNIGMLTGFSQKEHVCLTESTLLVEKQRIFFEKETLANQYQERLTSLVEKIDTTWRHAEGNISNKESYKEDLLLLEDYYRQKTILEQNLYTAKEHLYDVRNELSSAQEAVKVCTEKYLASTQTPTLSSIAEKAVPIEKSGTLQSNLLGTQETPTHAAPLNLCKVPGSVKACGDTVTKDGKTCKTYQECGTNLVFGTCTINPTTCQ